MVSTVVHRAVRFRYTAAELKDLAKPITPLGLEVNPLNQVDELDRAERALQHHGNRINNRSLANTSPRSWWCFRLRIKRSDVIPEVTP